MSHTTFARPSRGHLAAYDFLVKTESPFTRNEFVEGCNGLLSYPFKRSTISGYIRSFCEAGILEESPQHLSCKWQVKKGWEQTEAAKKLFSGYYWYR